MTKTTCPEHRRVGYAYSYSSNLGQSILTCKGCGLPPAMHETVAETITRLTVGVPA